MDLSEECGAAETQRERRAGLSKRDLSGECGAGGTQREGRAGSGSSSQAALRTQAAGARGPGPAVSRGLPSMRDFGPRSAASVLRVSFLPLRHMFAPWQGSRAWR